MSQDPKNKNYSWKNEDVFTISGAQFGLILNSLREILSTPEARKILLAQQASLAIEAVLLKGVEDGIVEETEVPKK